MPGLLQLRARLSSKRIVDDVGQESASAPMHSISCGYFNNIRLLYQQHLVLTGINVEGVSGDLSLFT